MSGQAAQITYRLVRTMDGVFPQRKASDLLAHLASYAVLRTRFPLPVVQHLFEKRVQR
jgi:hypothetical protein